MTASNKKRWTEREEQLFVQLATRFGKNFKRMEPHLPGRSYSQIRSHFYNHVRRELGREARSQESQKQIMTQKQEVEQVQYQEANVPEPDNSLVYTFIAFSEL
ncbi:protein_ODORANT1-like [Hexamita inflata]|uniref:Protein ODORANT1-like n=1 Tax=Hexamita inflata TaxID=28002 RepID=A0AA86TSB0_9EUKA|nr:protein ODORANT1-like [Hexamita inflata]